MPSDRLYEPAEPKVMKANYETALHSITELRVGALIIRNRNEHAIRYIRQHKSTGNNEMLWHLNRIEQILLGNDDGRAAGAEVKDE